MAGTLWHLLLFPTREYTSSFTTFLITPPPEWVPAKEWQGFKLDKTKVPNSTTQQAGRRKQFPLSSGAGVSSVAWSTRLLLHRVGESLEVWDTSQAGLALPCLHSRQTSITPSSPPVLATTLNYVTLWAPPPLASPGSILQACLLCYSCRIHKFYLGAAAPMWDWVWAPLMMKKG